MTQPFPNLGTPDLTRDEFQAVRDVKVGKRIAPQMQERLTLLKLAEQKLGGFSLTNAGEVRLVQEKTQANGAFPRRMGARFR